MNPIPPGPQDALEVPAPATHQRHPPSPTVLPFAASHQTLVGHQLATVQDVKGMQLVTQTKFRGAVAVLKSLGVLNISKHDVTFTEIHGVSFSMRDSWIHIDPR